MANHCRIAAASAQAALNAIVDRCDAGGAGSLVIYTGAEPAYADDAAGTEVATCALAATAYGSAAADGTNHWADADLASNAVDSSATGNASPVTYFRLLSGGGAVVAQGTIGTSGADLNLNTTTIAASTSRSTTTGSRHRRLEMTADPYFADLIADACQDGTLMGATMYLELCTSAPSKTVAGTPSGLGRVAVVMADDWTNDGEGGLDNDTTLDYGTAVDPATGVHWAELYDADVDGQRYLYGVLGDTYNILAGQPVSFPVGSLHVTIVT